MIKFVLSFLLLTLSLAVQAMKIEVHKNIVFASGAVGDDVVAFQEAFAKPGVDTVVFVNSPGGDLWTGLRVGRMIADQGLKTVAAGACISSCSIMFMGGKERTFSDAFSAPLTYIAIHGAHNKYTKMVDSNIQPRIFAFLKQNMADKFNAEIMNTALFDMDDAGALLRVFDDARFPKQLSYHCKSSQTPRKDCTNYKDATALNLGIVTSNTLTKLDLPESYKAKPMLFGKDLLTTISQPDKFYQDLADKHCTTEACKTLLKNIQSNKSEHRAVAVAVNGPGVGTVTGRVNESRAFISAVYTCNHVKDKPVRLCETKSVNQFDVQDFYAQADLSHLQALEKLNPPTDKFYADEQYGGGFTSFTTYKSQKWNDITPQKLDGVKIYSTQELAQSMKSSRAPVVIHVAFGTTETLPNALALINAGMAYEDAEKDREFEARFAGLLKLLVPDTSQEVVFYCFGRDSWFSVNAAVRAKKLGYTNVAWYRGGYQSWFAAKLPTASMAVRAVAD